MAAVFASPDDVQARFEQTIDPERTWQLLEDVELRLRRRVGNLNARIAAGTTSAAEVQLVVVSAALRVLRNPGGFRTETTPDYSYSVDRAVASGLVLFPPEDLVLLGVRSRRRLGAISLAVPEWQRP